MEAERRAFGSPEEAVRRIGELLAAEEWEALAACYDLEGSTLDPEEVARWEWFHHGGRPVADPRGGGGPRHPFPAGSTYRSHTTHGSLSRVTVETPPAAGVGPEEPGLRTFFLLRTEGGWRLLEPGDARISPID